MEVEGKGNLFQKDTKHMCLRMGQETIESRPKNVLYSLCEKAEEVINLLLIHKGIVAGFGTHFLGCVPKATAYSMFLQMIY